MVAAKRTYARSHRLRSATTRAMPFLALAYKSPIYCPIFCIPKMARKDPAAHSSQGDERPSERAQERTNDERRPARENPSALRLVASIHDERERKNHHAARGKRSGLLCTSSARLFPSCNRPARRHTLRCLISRHVHLPRSSDPSSLAGAWPPVWLPRCVAWKKKRNPDSRCMMLMPCVAISRSFPISEG